MLNRPIPLMLLMAVLAAIALAAPVSAAKPTSAACSSPTLAGPAEYSVGDTYSVEGCGFTPGALVPLEITEADGCCMALNVRADESGRFVYTDQVWAPGSYKVRASARHRSGNRWVVVAEWRFEAY